MSGCANLSDPLGGSYDGYSIKPLNAESLKGPQDLAAAAIAALGIPVADFQACSASPGAGAADTCRNRRNQIVSLLVLSSEEQCVEHRRTIYGKEAGFNIAAGTFVNIFSGWATVAPGQHQKSILSALALLSNSERSLVNELVYKSVIVPAVDKKILQIRDDKGRKLFGHFSESIQTYPMGIALYDAIDFHYTCSFMTGLEKALEEGTQETPKQKAERLKRDLTTLQAQVEADTTQDDKNVVFKNLKERYDSLSEEIKTLEKQ